MKQPMHDTISGKPLFQGLPPGSASLAGKHLTPDLLVQLSPLKTSRGFSLHDAIASGIANPDSTIGIYAGDAEAYALLSAVFDPIIADYHAVDLTARHCRDVSIPDCINLDPDRQFILSSRVRVARNLKGFRFMPSIKPDERTMVETMVRNALARLPKDLSGTYRSMETPSGKTSAEGFPRGDRFQEAAGINRDWPESRGIFTSSDTGLMIWVNEEDHLRIISLDRNADLGRTFQRLVCCLDFLERHLDFCRDPRLGYLTSCPSNLGTGMRAGVHIRLPELCHRPDLLEQITRDHHLQIRGTRGEKTRVEDAVFDISNEKRLGITERECIETLHKGLAAVLDLEKSL